ncbi:unnamed protein product [Penicillium salamii]|nr:unnamed protein product [Penicillium salamii]
MTLLPFSASPPKQTSAVPYTLSNPQPEPQPNTQSNTPKKP